MVWTCEPAQRGDDATSPGQGEAPSTPSRAGRPADRQPEDYADLVSRSRPADDRRASQLEQGQLAVRRTAGSLTARVVERRSDDGVRYTTDVQVAGRRRELEQIG